MSFPDSKAFKPALKWSELPIDTTIKLDSMKVVKFHDRDSALGLISTMDKAYDQVEVWLPQSLYNKVKHLSRYPVYLYNRGLKDCKTSTRRYWDVAVHVPTKD